MPHFSVLQGGKARQVDDGGATGSLAVIVLGNPETKIVYFVMIRHPFGLTPSVYNHNKRAAVPTGFQASEFRPLSVPVLL